MVFSVRRKDGINISYIYYNDCVFSSIFPDIKYSCTTLFPEVISSRFNGSLSVLIENSSKKPYYAKWIQYSEKINIDKYHDIIIMYYSWLITHPVHKNIIWPVDLIEIPLCFDDYKKGGVTVDNIYDPYISCNRLKKSNFALLFPYSENISNMEPLSYFIDELSMHRNNLGFSYNNPTVMKYLYSLLDAIIVLNSSKYLFNDFDESRLLYIKSDGTCVVDFSNVITSYDKHFVQLFGDSISYSLFNDLSFYSLSFGDPAFYNRTVERLDIKSQNYSLAALIFRLIFGVHPYDGIMNDYKIDYDKFEHFDKCQDYLKKPVFVFESNRENSLGRRKKYDYIRVLWDECSFELREMFLLTLSHDYALRVKKKYELFPGPKEWKNALKNNEK